MAGAALSSWNDGAARRAVELQRLAEMAQLTMRGAEKSLDLARAGGWTIVSMKDRGSTVFAPVPAEVRVGSEVS